MKDSLYILAGRGAATREVLASLILPKGVSAPNGDWLKSDSARYTLKNYEMVADSIPDVLNMGLKDALYLLENLGYRVKLSGKGRVVAQFPAGGGYLEKNGLIEIKLSDKYEAKESD